MKDEYVAGVDPFRREGDEATNKVTICGTKGEMDTTGLEDIFYNPEKYKEMEEPTRPKHITEVIEILAQAAKEYFERHPDKQAEEAGQLLLSRLAFLAGIEAAEEAFKNKKE